MNEKYDDYEKDNRNNIYDVDDGSSLCAGEEDGRRGVLYELSEAEAGL